MDLRKKLSALHQEFVQALSSITDFPKGLLPHIVYIEEESDSGYPIINRYVMTKINSDQTCIFLNPQTNREEVHQLDEINIEWLDTIWGYSQDLKIEEERNQLSSGGA